MTIQDADINLTEGDLIVNMEDEQKDFMSVQVPSDYFYVTDRMFKPLHGTTASSLTSRFRSIAAKAGLRIENDDDTKPKSKGKKTKFFHRLTFMEEVKVMRQLHPDENSAKDHEMLDTSNRTWRREAERELHFTQGHFGGSFKEHISVACLSRRCFELAQQIMEAYSRWELKQQTNNKINRMMFAQLPGVRSEDVIFEHLTKLKTKKISKAEFNEELKIFKRDFQEEAERFKKERKATREISTTSTELRRQNMRLIREKEELRRELKTLRSKLSSNEVEDAIGENADNDIYDYHSDSEDLSLFQEAEEATQQSQEEEIVLQVPPMKYSRHLGSKVSREDQSGKREQAPDDTFESESDEELSLRLEESDEEMILRTPTHTYGRSIPASSASPTLTTPSTTTSAAIDLKPSSPRQSSTTEQNFVITLEKIHLLQNPEKDQEQYYVCSFDSLDEQATEVQTEKQQEGDTREKKNTDEKEKLHIQDCVLAKDGTDDEWYKAKVLKVNEDQSEYYVHYMGYSASFNKWVKETELKKYLFAKDEKVSAMWEDGFYYRGRVLEICNEGYTIQFEDGVIFTTKAVKF